MQSPCIKVCVLDERGVCKGCKRTSQEISEWMFYSAEERRLILEELKRRK